MSEKIPRPLLFILSFLLCLGLYWPSLQGTPIWDDWTYWFKDPVMAPSFSYLTIWKDFAWPLSVSVQKLLLNWWQENYLYYHLLNLGLHFVNSGLVYRLGKVLKLKHPFILFLLFLLHPTCVISVGWMIQLKTLLCMFFALLAVLAFVRGHGDKRWYLASWIFFSLSIISKSASLPLPVILTFFLLRKDRRRHLVFVLPFFLIAGLSTFRMLSSSVTQSGVKRAAEVTEVKVTPPPQSTSEEKRPQATTPPAEAPPKKEETVVTPPPIDERPASPVELFKFSPALTAKTIHYYFWQTFLPISNEPVKGLNRTPLGYVEVIHLLFLILVLVLLRKDQSLFWILSGYVLLLPFIGLVPAPYMNITWVSDQHLYLVLPAFLGFWLKLLEKIKWKHAHFGALIFVSFYAYETANTARFYQGQSVFYESAVRANPTNVPIVYNLAFTYLAEDRWNEAYDLLAYTYQLSKEETYMTDNPYWKHVALLYLQMKHSLER